MSTYKQTVDGVLVSLSIKLERLLMDAEQLQYRAEKASEEFKWFVEHLPELMATPEWGEPDFKPVHLAEPGRDLAAELIAERREEERRERLRELTRESQDVEGGYR